MCIVNNAVQDGISKRGFADHLMPLGHGQLSGNERGFPSVALFEDFEQIEPLLIGKGMRSPIVQDQQLNAGELVNQSREATVVALPLKGFILTLCD